MHVRRICEDFTVSEEKVVSVWSPYPKIQVETVVIPEEWGHKRIHRIVSNISCAAYDCGFGIASDPSDEFTGKTEEGTALAENRYAFCRVTGKYTEVAGERGRRQVLLLMRIPIPIFFILRPLYRLCSII